MTAGVQLANSRIRGDETSLELGKSGATAAIYRSR